MGHKSKYTYGFVHNVYPHSMWAADRSGDGENYSLSLNSDLFQSQKNVLQMNACNIF